MFKKDHQLLVLLYLIAYIVWCSSTQENRWKQAQIRENVKKKLSSHSVFYFISKPTISYAFRIKGIIEEKIQEGEEKRKTKSCYWIYFCWIFMNVSLWVSNYLKFMMCVCFFLLLVCFLLKRLFFVSNKNMIWYNLLMLLGFNFFNVFRQVKSQLSFTVTHS